MDLEAIKRMLLVKYPAFSGIVLNTQFIEREDVITAATDGEVVYYNTNFMNKLNNDEQLFVFAHEICHMAFNHIQRKKDKDTYIWNIATDAVINALLKKDGLSVLENAVNIEDAINHDAEEMYNILLEQKQKDPEKNFQNQESQNGDGNNTFEDNHDIWNEQKNYNENKQVSEQKTFQENRKEKIKKLKELKKELQKESEQFGNDIKGNKININDVGVSKQLIDWRKVLKSAICKNYDWSYKNASIENGIITPHLEEILESNTEILLDTSGSIDDDILKSFLRECKHIFNTSKIKVGCFDTKFYGFQDIKNVNDIDKLKFVGGGGTDFTVAIEAFSSRVDNKIIFTDGRSFMPNQYCNCIWVVFGDKKIEPIGGKVIYIDENELVKRKTK